MAKTIDPAELQRALAIRRRVRLDSGRPDGRCGKVSEAIQADLGWAYRWGHLRLLDGEVCWIHCWNELPDGTVVDTTADQFEERWLGDMAVLPPDHPLQANYHAMPPGHLFRVERTGDDLRLLARRAERDQAFATDEGHVAVAADTPAGWAELGARAVEIHSGWSLSAVVAQDAGETLRTGDSTGPGLPSRELEFALDAAARRRRIAGHGEWTSPEWRESEWRQCGRADRKNSPSMIS